jgi:hypothetical protein
MSAAVRDYLGSLPLTRSERALVLFLAATGAAGVVVLACQELQGPKFHPVLIQGTPGVRREADSTGLAVRESAPFPLDVNTANPFQLQALPGIGKKLSYRIVADRERRGPFGSVDELLRVPGITAKKIDALRRFVLPGRTTPWGRPSETRLPREVLAPARPSPSGTALRPPS